MAPMTARTPDASEERPIRYAASVIAGRDGGDGLEILVVERGAASRFLPGYVAFPGGAVDIDDGDLADRWFGDAREAARAAAVRELAEETGIDVAGGGLATTVLPEICHWVAPPEVPVRFDARYFAIAVAAGIDPVPDGGETAAAWWTPPSLLFGEWERGDRKLYWPSWYTVRQLTACATVTDLLGLRFETREPTPEEGSTMPASVMEQVP
jgi:8-oxo-dGTP pyrophosphatase MutT (NUDIX family)